MADPHSCPPHQTSVWQQPGWLCCTSLQKRCSHSAVAWPFKEQSANQLLLWPRRLGCICWTMCSFCSIPGSAEACTFCSLAFSLLSSLLHVSWFVKAACFSSLFSCLSLQSFSPFLFPERTCALHWIFLWVRYRSLSLSCLESFNSCCCLFTLSCSSTESCYSFLSLVFWRKSFSWLSSSTVSFRTRMLSSNNFTCSCSRKFSVVVSAEVDLILKLLHRQML